MRLPDRVPVTLLEQRHTTWDALRETWETLSDLKEGAPALLKRREKYLPKRPGERPDLYQLRLDKFAYTPILSTAIREFGAKLASAPIHISGLQQSTSDTFWATWLESCDGDRMDHDALLGHLFSTLLYYGRCYVALEKPRLGVRPRNKAEEPRSYPYILFYDPLLVTNWGDGWYLTRQIDTVSEPMQPPRKVATWVYWMTDRTTTYQADVKLNTLGDISAIQVEGKWVNPRLKSATVAQTVNVPHTLGRPALLQTTLEAEDWVGAQAFLKQLQHLRIESSWTDAGTMAGIVQRVYVPPAATPTDDPRISYETPDYSEMNFEGQHVLIGADYKFVESTGDAIANLTRQLETIEHQIRSIASMGWQSASTTALEQSGVSKMVDQALLQDTLKKFGKVVKQIDQDILQMVARLAGRTDLPNVSGLDTYSTDTLGSLLAASETVDLVSARLPNTALRIFYGKLSNLLTGSVSPEDAQQIQEELQEIFSGQGLDPDSPEDVSG